MKQTFDFLVPIVKIFGAIENPQFTSCRFLDFNGHFKGQDLMGISRHGGSVSDP